MWPVIRFVDYLTVSSGPCTITVDDCFRSPNYPSNYSNNQDCVFNATRTFGLRVVTFQTEAGFDKLFVNEVEYSGTVGPDGEWIAVGAQLRWSSDESVTAQGFEICIEAPVPGAAPEGYVCVTCLRAGACIGLRLCHSSKGGSVRRVTFVSLI